MLVMFYTLFSFKKHVKTGLYVDYFLKLIALQGLLNIFIWASLYVSEKFIIEYTTRYLNNFSTNTNILLNNSINIFTFTLKWLALGISIFFLL